MSFTKWVDAKAEKLQEKTSVHASPWSLFIMGLVVIVVGLLLVPGGVTLAISGALFLAPLWLPFLVVRGAIDLWYIYKRSEFLANQKHMILEIKPPRNLVKTPLAMEAFLSTLHLTGGESTWWAQLMGGTRPFWSLEIASFEGQVHFYLWGRAGFRRLVESQLYAQYPGVQITEVADYTRTLPVAIPPWFVWGCDFRHTEKDSDPLPIKTYVEYGLDKVQKEPEQIDPLAQLIEFMGAIGKGEYVWLQYIIRAHKGEKYKKEKYTWVNRAKEMVEDIRKATQTETIDPTTGKKFAGFPNPTKGQSEKIAAIERNVSKLAFDVGIRGLYMASSPDKINGGMIGHLISLYKPFTSAGWNGIDSSGWLKNFNDYPWEVWEEKRKDKYRRQILEAYRRRQFFYPPYYEAGISQDKVMVMSTEELATIYHIPSRSVETPGLGRMTSATSDAPVNLPT